MTYWSYHLIFTIPLIILLGILIWPHLRRGHFFAWGVTCIIVMIFTTPWDNYAAYLGIWGFGDNVSLGYPFADQADQRSWLGHIPFEEYAYFIIEATLVCQLVIYLMIRSKRRATGP